MGDTSTQEQSVLSNQKENKGTSFSEQEILKSIGELREKVGNAKTFAELPHGASLDVIGSQVIARFAFRPPKDKDDMPDDPLYRQFYEVQVLNNQRRGEFGALPYDSHLLPEVMKEKGKIIEYLSPGNFLAHGGYVDDLEKLIEAKGLMSSVARVKARLLSSEEIPRWRTAGFPTHPDAIATFFFAWEGENKYAGIYASTSGDFRGTTDMVFLYPSEEAVERAKVWMIKTGGGGVGEIAVTNSEASLEKGELVNDGNDDLLLPLEKAYLILPEDKYDASLLLLQKGGYSPEWIQTHVRKIPIRRWTGDGGRGHNDLYDKLPVQRTEISEWMRKSDSVAMAHVQVERVNIFGDIYRARLVKGGE